MTNKIILIGILSSVLSGYGGSGVPSIQGSISSRSDSVVSLSSSNWLVVKTVFEEGIQTVKLVNDVDKSSTVSIINSFTDIDIYDRKSYVETIRGYSKENLGYLHSVGVEGDYNIELYSWEEGSTYNKVMFLEKGGHTSIIVYHLENNCNIPTFREILSYVNC